MAAVSGFLLTAIPNWTGRLPVRRHRLAILALLWLTGRIACLFSADLPAWLTPAIDLAFPATLLAVAAREIKLRSRQVSTEVGFTAGAHGWALSSWRRLVPIPPHDQCDECECTSKNSDAESSRRLWQLQPEKALTNLLHRE